MLQWFEGLTLPQFVAVLSVANVLMYVGSWGTVRLVQHLFRARLLNVKPPAVSRDDIRLSVLIVLINIAVGLPGWWLWKQGYIELADPGALGTLVDVVLVFLYFDVAMYFLHRVMHIGWLYRLAHGRHHDHVDVNGLSFYVMNPLEAAGFGGLLVVFLALCPISFDALMIYLLFNWIYGTMAHSGVPVENRLLSWLVGDTEFHHKHHAQLRGNFGFYTGAWDRLFRTAL